MPMVPDLFYLSMSVDSMTLKKYNPFMNTASRTAKLGNRVRERRQELRLSQTELARRAGVVRQTVNQIENVEGYQATTVVCLRIAEALGQDVSDLFFEEVA